MTLSLNQKSQFIEKLPKKPYCAENYKHTTVIRSKSHAIQYAHIQLNSPHVYNHIILDIDYPIADPETQQFIWESGNLPEPTHAVINERRSSRDLSDLAIGNSHLIFTLEAPVYASNEKQYAFYCDVKDMLTEIYKADRNYKATLTKNPLNDHWQTISNDNVYTLSELKLYAPKRTKYDNVIQFNRFKRHSINHNTAQLGRNCRLFEDTRIIAYAKVKSYHTYEAFYECVLDTALENNHGGLSYNEVSDTARSIARYTWKNKDHVRSYTRRRVSSIDELRQRQRTAANETAILKRSKTIAIIEQGIRAYIKEGVAMPTLTKETLSRLTGKSVATINRYAAEIDHIIRCVYQDLSPVLASLKNPPSQAQVAPSSENQVKQQPIVVDHGEGDNFKHENPYSSTPIQHVMSDMRSDRPDHEAHVLPCTLERSPLIRKICASGFSVDMAPKIETQIFKFKNLSSEATASDPGHDSVDDSLKTTLDEILELIEELRKKSQTGGNSS